MTARQWLVLSNLYIPLHLHLSTLPPSYSIHHWAKSKAHSSGNVFLSAIALLYNADAESEVLVDPKCDRSKENKWWPRRTLPALYGKIIFSLEAPNYSVVNHLSNQARLYFLLHSNYGQHTFDGLWLWPVWRSLSMIRILHCWEARVICLQRMIWHRYRSPSIDLAYSSYMVLAICPSEWIVV
jgi:hypothetical protein